MARSDWDIGGDGGQGITDVDGSKRCELSGIKWMAWNGDSELTDVEIIADIRLYGTNGYNQGGLFLRAGEGVAPGSDPTWNCYRFRRQYQSHCYLDVIANGVKTQLAYATTSFNYNQWVRTRFRIDGWQISVDEYFGSDWQQLMLVEDTSHHHLDGYVGLIGTNTNSVGSILYDDIEISEKA